MQTCYDQSVIPVTETCPTPPMPEQPRPSRCRLLGWLADSGHATCPPREVGPFIVFFDWDKDEITPQAAGILDNAAQAYQTRAAASCSSPVTPTGRAPTSTMSVCRSAVRTTSAPIWPAAACRTA